MPQPSPLETQLLRNLVRLHRGDPQSYSAAVLQTGCIRVSGPRGAAFYPLEGWVSRFVRHLHQGYFDAATPAWTAAPAAASAEGGTG